MRMKLLGVAGLAMLPAMMIAQTPTPTPPPTDTTSRDMTMRDTTMRDTTTMRDMMMRDTTAKDSTVMPVPNPTMNMNPPPTGPTTSTEMNVNTGPSTNNTGATISSMGSAPATGSAFAMGNRTAARDSLTQPKPVPPSDGTTCPWGCPTSRGTAGLTGPQFLALQQELRDAKCGLGHVTGRLDAATRSAIRTCARKMGVANNAAAVLVGFDIGFTASDVNVSGDAAKQEE